MNNTALIAYAEFLRSPRTGAQIVEFVIANRVPVRVTSGRGLTRRGEVALAVGHDAVASLIVPKAVAARMAGV